MFGLIPAMRSHPADSQPPIRPIDEMISKVVTQIFWNDLSLPTSPIALLFPARISLAFCGVAGLLRLRALR